MAGGGGRGAGEGSGNGKGHKQATPEQIADLRERLTGLEATDASVLRYRWFTDDRVLHRFITARNGNVDVALKMLLEHLEWRTTYKLDTILDEDLSGAGVSHEFYWSGFDRDGRPCLVFRACEHRKSDSDGASPTVEEKVRYYCQLLERGFRDFSPAYKFCLILDCRGAGTNVMDRRLFKVATPIIENNFPETQHATYVLPCNGVIMMAWKVISSFIDPGTADKIRLVKDFDDPALVKAFSPETLKAFISVKPSMAPPQPYVAPDPLANPPPPSKSSASFLSSNNINNGGNDDNALLSSETLEDDSLGGGEGQGHHHPAQQSRNSAATTLTAAAPVGNGGGDDGNHSSSAVPLPPPSPGGSTALGGGGGGGAPSPSGSQVPRPEAAGMMMQPGLSPAGAAAAVQHRASLAAAAAAAAGGEAPPSPSGSNIGQHPAAPPSPAGDSLYATSMTGGVEGGESTGGGKGREGGASGNNVFDERFISKSSTTHPNGGIFGGVIGGDKLDSSRQDAGSSVSAPRPPPPAAAAATAGAEPATTAPPASASGAPRPPVTVQGNGRLEGAAAATAAGVTAGGARPPAATAVRGGSGLSGGGGGFGRGYGEEVQRATSRTLEFTERTGVLYKRRDTLRGRFAYRQQYAVLRFAPPEAASLSSLRRESGSGGVPLPPPPPTLTLLKGRGKSETEKVMSLEGAEVTLGTAMAGDLYPFVISFSSTAPPTMSPSRSYRGQPPPPPQQQGLPPRRNTEDYMFTGVLDAASAAAASSPTGNGDGGDAGSSGRRQQQQHVLLGTAAGGGGGGGDGGNTPSGPMTTASSSTVTSPYKQWPPLPSNTTASNASSSSRIMIRGNSSSSSRKRSDSIGSSSTGGGAVWQRKTLHLGCDTEEETLQWARWLADAVALHGAASEAAAAAERRGEGGGGGGPQEAAPWRGSTGGPHPDLSAADVVGRTRAYGGGVTTAASRGKPPIAEQEGSSVPPPRRRREGGDDAELSYRSKYEEALDALAAVSGGGRAGGSARTREGGDAVVVVGPGGGAPTGKKFRTMLDSYRRSKANNDGGKDSSQEPPPFSSSSKPPPPPAPRKSGSLRDTFSRRRGSSRSSLGTSTAAGAVLKGLGEAGGALMSMRDTEISRLRRAYARSELSREEMKRCLRALAVQLREGEDRTGALMADREAALCKINAKEEEFAKKEALLEEGKARATAEAQQKEELVTSLQVENQALQAALERLRLDFQEERSLRLQSGPAAAAAAAAASKVRPSTPSRLGVFRRRGLTSRHGGTPAAAAAAGEGGKVSSRREGVSRPPATPTRHNRLLSGPSFLNHHIRSTPGRSGSGGGMLAGGGGGGSGAIAAAATPGGVGWSSVHGGIGSRHSTAAGAAGAGRESWVQEGAGAQAAEGLPWVLNTDQAWAGGARPPHEVLDHLLEELEGIKAMSGAAVEGGGARGGEKKEGPMAETAAFVEWSHRTGELQEVPPLEKVDMPGERTFTEGCLKLLSAHAAAVLRKEPDQLTAREEARMAYAIGGGMYTIERLSAHLDALGAGLPTE